MVKSNKILLSVLLVVTAGLLISGGYIILNSENLLDKKSAEPSKNNDAEQYIENTTKDVRELSPEAARELGKKLDIMSDTNLTKNAKLSFKLGDRFLYESFHQLVGDMPRKIGNEQQYTTLFDSYNMVVEYIVDDKIRWNKTDYFKITEYTHEHVFGMVTTPERGTYPAVSDGVNETFYVKTDTGEFFREIESGELEIVYMPPTSYFFKSWMLTLDDNFKTKKEMPFIYGYESHFAELSVEGREKINGRECFKVKEEETGCNKNTNCELLLKTIYYIDVNKRIVVKYEVWTDNVRGLVGELTEENLVSQ